MELENIYAKAKKRLSKKAARQVDVQLERDAKQGKVSLREKYKK